MEGARKLIVYACPTGPLAEQVAAYYGESRARFGPNSAHAYPPHITLTGFFHDAAEAIPAYVAALEAAHARAMADQPPAPVVIRELHHHAEFHGLLIESPWLEALTAAFAAVADSPTRRDPIRLKSWLHLSLAYGFRTEDGPALGALAAQMVQITAPVGWELRLYERQGEEGWVCHINYGLTKA